MSNTTTVSITLKVKAKLDDLKIYPEESYNTVIDRLTENAYDDEPLSDEEIKGIEKGLRDYADGKFYTEEEVWGDLGIDKKCIQ